MQPPLEGEYVEVHNAADEGNFDNDDEIGPLNVSGKSTGFVQTRELDIEILVKEVRNLPCLWDTSILHLSRT